MSQPKTKPQQKLFHTFKDDALGYGDAFEIAGAIKRKDVSPREVLDASIKRAQTAGILNAIAEEQYDSAFDRSRFTGTAAAPFYGIPTFIKDNEEVAGMATRYGSRAVPNKPAKESSPFVEQLLSTGVTVLGKTTMPEFGLSASTESLHHGDTRNPWHTSRSTGGSSGGSAALVAAGVVPVAHGNDGGGSIRIPAACCGLVGLRPSRNRLQNMPGTESLPVNLVSNGVLTRSMRDTAHFLAAMENHQPSKTYHRVGLVEHPSKRRLRIAFFDDSPEVKGVSAEVKSTCDDTAKLLEELGHEVVQVPYPFSPDGGEKFKVYYGLMAFVLSNFGPLMYGLKFDKSKLEDLTHGLSRHFSTNAWRLPSLLMALARHTQEYKEMFENYDVMMCPVVSHSPPELGFMSAHLDFNTLMDRLHDFAAFTPVQNVSGAPALSLPMGSDTSGLPIGLMFSSGIGDERTLLELGYELEEARPFRNIWESV